MFFERAEQFHDFLLKRYAHLSQRICFQEGVTALAAVIYCAVVQQAPHSTESTGSTLSGSQR